MPSRVWGRAPRKKYKGGVVTRKPKVAFVLGSDSDYPAIEQALETLESFDVPFEVTISSAHRSPDRTHRYAATLEERGIQVVIACAGGAAHLAGVIAANTILPVIGVPIDSSPLQGLDALLSTSMMPVGVHCARLLAKPTITLVQTPSHLRGDWRARSTSVAGRSQLRIG